MPESLRASLPLTHQREQFMSSIVINRKEKPAQDVIVCVNLVSHLLTFAPVEDVLVGSWASFIMGRNKGSLFLCSQFSRAPSQLIGQPVCE